MKKITMKGKNVDEAVDAALKVLGGEKEKEKRVGKMELKILFWLIMKLFNAQCLKQF